MMQQIPLRQLPSQSFQIILDGQYCTITLYWKQKQLYLDLLVGNEPVIVGHICQNRANILQSPNYKFRGTLHFWDTRGDRPPAWGELDTRYILLFLSEGEEIPEALRY